MILLYIAFEFFKTGLFTIGGGLATLPFLYDISNKYGWFTHSQLSEMIAISESTPGPIGVNMATYTGYITAGPLGGIIATLSTIIPSIIISIFVMKFITQFKNNMKIDSFFKGVRPAVAGLIAFAGYGIIKVTLFNVELYNSTKEIMDLVNISSIVLFIVMIVWTNKSKMHPVIFLGVAGLVGVLVGL